MRIVENNVYTLDELSDQAKDRAYSRWLRSFDYPWHSENQASWDAFESRSRISEWYDGNILELSGVRAATWIHNNWTWLWEGKWYAKYYPKVRLLRSKRFLHRRSKILLERAMLTGYCMDYDCTDPIFEFLAKPDSRTIEDLLKECRESYKQACQADFKYLQSFEHFEEYCEANGYEFTESGEWA